MPVTVATYWYDNHGPAALQHSQDLMHSQRFVGSLALGISALIAAITSITVAAAIIESTSTYCQYVDTMSKNVSLALCLAYRAIDRKLEMRVDALEEAIIHIGTELQALKQNWHCPVMLTIGGYV